jgi:hypothetical protein
MEYIIIGVIKGVTSIGAVAGKDIASAPPTEIVRLRTGRISLGPRCDESFVDGGGGCISLAEASLRSGSTAGSIFVANWSLRELFSFINFDLPKYKASKYAI